MTHHPAHDPLADLSAACTSRSPATREGLADSARHRQLDQLSAVGVDFDDVTEYLERDGLAEFEQSWGELGATVAAELEGQHTTR